MSRLERGLHYYQHHRHYLGLDCLPTTVAVSADQSEPGDERRESNDEKNVVKGHTFIVGIMLEYIVLYFCTHISIPCVYVGHCINTDKVCESDLNVVIHRSLFVSVCGSTVCMCACMCVCESERERGRGRKRGKERGKERERYAPPVKLEPVGC